MSTALSPCRARDQLEELPSLNIKKARAFVSELVIHEVNVDEGWETDVPGTHIGMLEAYLVTQEICIVMRAVCMCFACVAWHQGDVHWPCML